jgi:phosphoribosylformimino-5-aminoimidazole carboxamide ribotide isomerase
MKIIPVIDLKDGLVVHAKQGQRDDYHPINTALCPSARLVDVLQAFLSLAEFDTFYIADLNAITGTGNHCDQLLSIMAQFPAIKFWVDAGRLSELKMPRVPQNWLPVLGSESFNNQNLTELDALNKNFILSLDFLGLRMLGADALFTNMKQWPETIIIMTLDRVGSQQGPDLKKLAEYATKYPDKSFVAAGSVRDWVDLVALQNIGIHHALIASALHSGQITSTDMTNLSAKKCPD